MYKDMKIFDSHTHVGSMESIKTLAASESKHSIDRFAVMSLNCTGITHLAQNLTCALAKMMYPGKIFAFGGLTYPQDPTQTDGQELLDQVVRLRQLGFDGMKMLEGKPDTRKKNGLSLDSPVYDKYYKFLEEEGIPITYHVADPKVFWDEDKAPDWAKKEGWTYTDGSFVSKEALYSEVNGFLSKFPRLKITFAHFFFMGEEGPEKASEFLDSWPNVNYDLTPGIEMYGSFSEAPDRWRQFFIKYQDRIIFGSDNGLDESLVYIDTTRRFLETYEEFQIRDLNIKGIGLDNDILEKIYHGNFEKLVGKTAARIDGQRLLRESDRVIDMAGHYKNAAALVPEIRDIREAIKKLLA